MIKKFDEFINENVFDDMIKRNRGEDIRKEDDINQFDAFDMYHHIFDIYEFNKDEIKKNHIRPIPFPIGPTHDSEMEGFRIILDSDNRKDTLIDVLYKYGKINSLKVSSVFLEKSTTLQELEEKYYIPESSDNYHCIIILDKDSRTITNDIVMDVIDIILKNAVHPILKKRELHINENVFDDMISRSKNSAKRTEDIAGINNMNAKELGKYILDEYEEIKPAEVTYSEYRIWIPVILFGTGRFCYLLEYLFDKKMACVNSNFLMKYDALSKVLKDKYTLKVCHPYEDSLYYEICPKDGSEFNNIFFLDIIDTIIENVPTPGLKKKKI